MWDIVNVVSLTRLHAGCILVLRSDIQWLHRDVTQQTNDYTGWGALRCLVHSNWCNSKWVCHNSCPKTQEEALYLNGNNNGFRPQGGQGWNQPRPYYKGGNGNSFNPNQPTLRDLVYGQAKINESLQKKLAATDKSMETIHAKMDGSSTTIKNQLSFNKMLETQLAQLAAATPAAELGKIPGQPESTLESINVVNTMWEKPPSKAPFISYAEKLTRPEVACGVN